MTRGKGFAVFHPTLLRNTSTRPLAGTDFESPESSLVLFASSARTGNTNRPFQEGERNRRGRG